MPTMLRSKASNNQLSGRFNSSQIDLHDGEHPPRPSSRLSSFANFRRSSLLPTMSSSNLASSSNTNSRSSPAHQASSYESSSFHTFNKGGVDDVPTSATSRSSSRIPIKPPKPAALRVKKAKALSISLLHPGSKGGQSTTKAAEGYPQSQVQPHSAHSLSPATLQEALAAEQETDTRYPAREASRGPSRSASALDLYRTHGPMKGLLSGSSRTQQQATKEAVAQRTPKSANESHFQRSDKIFPGGVADAEEPQQAHYLRKRRSNSFSLSRLAGLGGSSTEQKPATKQQFAAPSWKLDTAKELLSEQQRYDERGMPASPSLHSTTSSQAPFRTAAHGATASPFLNKFSVRAKNDRDHNQPTRPGHGKGPHSFDSASSTSSPPSPASSRIPRYKNSAVQLGKADILRSTHRPSMESLSSGYQSPNGPSSPMRTNGRPSSSGGRTSGVRPSSSGGRSSTQLSDGLRASPGKGNHRSQARPRTQPQGDKATLSPLQRWEDSTVPRHPLAAEEESSSTRANGSNETRNQTAALAPPPPKRNVVSRISTYDGLQPRSNFDAQRSRPSTAMSNYTSASGTSLQHIGHQIGGMGAAVGKRGWDMFKQWSATSGPQAARRGAAMTTSLSTGNDMNRTTRAWLAVLNDHTEKVERFGIFGMPLREAVLLTRLGGASRETEFATSGTNRQTSIAMDLGSEFKIEIADIDHSPGKGRTSRALAASREMARLKYLPGIVVRCIQAVEAAGLEEEGLYRLSGRSTHTAKLRQIFNTIPKSARHVKQSLTFDATCSDLCLAEISPADLDLNSITSLLKAYLRELPQSLIGEPLASELNALLERECGVSAVGLATQIGGDNDARAIKAATSANATQDTKGSSLRIARLVSTPLRSLPPANWYLLRELAMHLSDLTRPNIVAQTRMPLNNLCLVLAPTLSLSVPMMRAMVEGQNEMFGRLGPAVDEELDNAVSSSFQKTSGSALRSTFAPTLNQALLLPRPNVEERGEDEKRLSVSTVTGKRESTSSVATVQGRQSLFSPTSPFAAASYEDRAAKILKEEDDAELCASPIAAKFIRKRTGSIAGSLSYSNFGSDNGSVRRPSASASTPKLVQQESTTATVDNGSNDHSSGPPSADGFSSAASSLTPSISSSSLRTSSALASVSDALHSPSATFALHSSHSPTTYAPLMSGGGGGGGALDRPRPPTGASAKFMGGRPLGKERSGTSASRGHSRSTSALEILPMPASRESSDLPTPTTFYQLPEQETEEGDETVRPSSATTMDKLIDDAPMDVGAVRQYWNVRGMA